MKQLIIIAFVMAQCVAIHAQKYFTREGDITFLSNAPMEEISATNSKATSVFDASTGDIEWAVLISAFKFKKALMEEHFNENYMESTKHPKSVFKGKINDMSAIDLTTDGTYTTTVSGELEIRSIKQAITPEITFTIRNGKISGACQFTVAVADFDISIPKLVRENIAKEVEISVNAEYKAL